MIIKMYVTTMPVIFAGIFNMLFVRTNIYKRLKKPIDGGLVLSDGKRLFGNNKTWIGFVGMILFAMISQVLWGFICIKLLKNMNYLYDYNSNTVSFNLFSGAVLGFAYVLFELPNSLIKRRFDIPDGKTVKGIKGRAFFIIDQVDSLIGVSLVLAIFYPMSLWQYFFYIMLGATTHIAVNLVLYKIKIRKNI